MPLTPDANLRRVSHGPAAWENPGDDILDKLLSLDVGQTVHTGDTITVKLPVSGQCSRFTHSQPQRLHICCRARSNDDARQGAGATMPRRVGRFLFRRTRQTERDQSRRDQTPPGRRGYAARGWKRPRWEWPWHRRRCVLVWSRRRGQRFVPVVVGKNRMVSPTMREWWCFGLRLDPRPQSVQPSASPDPTPAPTPASGRARHGKAARPQQQAPPTATARGPQSSLKLN